MTAIACLSARELAVLRAYAELGSVKLVARQLDLSPHTVRSHLANIRAIARVPTTAQAVWRFRRILDRSPAR